MDVLNYIFWDSCTTVILVTTVYFQCNLLMYRRCPTVNGGISKQDKTIKTITKVIKPLINEDYTYNIAPWHSSMLLNAHCLHLKYFPPGMWLSNKSNICLSDHFNFNCAASIIPSCIKSYSKWHTYFMPNVGTLPSIDHVEKQILFYRC